MRSFFILAVLVFRFAVFAHAQRVGHAEEPEPERGPEPATEENPDGAINPNGQYDGEAVGVPGALAVGQNPKPSPEDDEIDFDDIADALKELIEKIVDAVDDSQGTTQSTTATAATITQAGPLPSRATPCTVALDAYSSCSTAYNSTFSAVAATVQAGCLCNAYDAFDFNGQMERCYSYAQNQSQFRSYAAIIANATAACTCQPYTVITDGFITETSGCKPTSSSAAATTSSLGSSAEQSPTPNGAVRSLSACLSVVLITAVLGVMSGLH